jgi:hypothetical protein
MRKLILYFILCLSWSAAWAQENIIQFKLESKSELTKISELVSIDNYENGIVTAYANAEQLEQFKKLAYQFEILPHPSAGKTITMATTTAEMADWDRYPTYDVYLEMMNQFETDFPDLCQTVNIGTSVNDRELLAVKISDNVATHEAEPEFFYTSTMHGDETTGFVLLLRLADWLLSNYETDERAAYIVDNFELYINPNANPDGTYRNDNNTISDALRYNANNVDINRDFPDPRIGSNSPYQAETQAMMAFAENRNFVVSANFHGGIELANYPWDTWTEGSPDYHPHADSDWWQKVAGDYRDSAQGNSPAGYFDDYGNGLTNGGDWYVITGGRQDYMNYFRHCRELTLEISGPKLPASDELPNYWNYNFEAMLNYIKTAAFGFYGTVSNTSGDPLDAKIEILSHDQDNSWVLTDSEHGDYYRPIAPGIYDVQFSSEGYVSQNHSIDVASWESISENNVILETSTNVNTPTVEYFPTVSPNPAKDFFTIAFSKSSATPSVQLLDITGRPVQKNIPINEAVPIKALPAGYYIIVVKTVQQVFTKKLIIR